MSKHLLKLAGVAALVLSAVEASAQTFVNTALVEESAPVQPLPAGLQTSAAAFADANNDKTLSTAENAAAWALHRDYARANPDEFRAAAAHLDTAPATAKVRVEANDPAYVAVVFARRASDPLEARIALNEAGNAAPVRTAQAELRARLADARERRAGWPVIVFATGTVRESLGTPETSKDDGKQPISTGSLGASVRTRIGLVTALASVVSTDKVIESNFGPSVLSPGAGASLSAALLDFRLGTNRPVLPGVGTAAKEASGNRIRIPLPNHLYLSGASSRWRAGGQSTDPAVHVTVFGAGALWESALVDEKLGETEIALRVEMGVSGRVIAGDASRNEFIENALDGAHIVGGLEGGFTLTFGRVTAASQLYLYQGEGGGDIDRLTGLQMVAGLSVSGEFLRGRLPVR